jgi:hypothetical protein
VRQTHVGQAQQPKDMLRPLPYTPSSAAEGMKKAMHAMRGGSRFGFDYDLLEKAIHDLCRAARAL